MLTQVSDGDPGANAWAPNPDPLTQIGDETWQDYAVAADVVFSASTTPQYSVSEMSDLTSGLLSAQMQSVTKSRVSEREVQWRQGHAFAKSSAGRATPPSSTDSSVVNIHTNLIYIFILDMYIYIYICIFKSYLNIHLFLPKNLRAGCQRPTG